MKIIEGLKEIKQNKVKIVDLQTLIDKHSAHLDISTPEYGDNTKKKIAEWIQSIHDTTKRNIELLLAIQRTNLETKVKVKIGDDIIENSIAHWIWRRREYAAIDLATWQKLTDKGLRDQRMKLPPNNEDKDVKVVRNFDPEQRDSKIMKFKLEASKAGPIDAALEIANAVTDLIGV